MKSTLVNIIARTLFVSSIGIALLLVFGPDSFLPNWTNTGWGTFLSVAVPAFLGVWLAGVSNRMKR